MTLRITVAPGGSLDVQGGRITGTVTAAGATSSACRHLAHRTSEDDREHGARAHRRDRATGPCAANTIVGPLRMTGKNGGMEFNGTS